jgi:hypothetical protein
MAARRWALPSGPKSAIRQGVSNCAVLRWPKPARAVAALTDYGFATLGARKVWLDASGENPRAQKLYADAGYRLEGRLVDHWFRPALGRNVDVMLYGMFRAEWQALAAPAPQA